MSTNPKRGMEPRPHESGPASDHLMAQLTTWPKRFREKFSITEGAGEQIKATVQVYTAALAQMQKTLADMLRIGLSAEALRAAKERPSREQAEALQRVIDGLLGGLDLSAEQRAKVPAALADVLTREGLL